MANANTSAVLRENIWRRHAWRRGLLFVLLVLAINLVRPRAALCGTGWAFAFAEPGVDDYDVAKGSAVVTIENAKLTATMRSKEGVEYKLTGKLSKGHVEAKFTVVGSEVVDMPFSGTYVVRRWPSDAVDTQGRESLVLTNGLSVLALTRGIPR